MGEPSNGLWSEFRVRFQRANEHLASEIAVAGADVRLLLDQSRQQLTSITSDQLEPGKLASFERLFGEIENHLFSEPLGSFERLGPMGRTLSAIERHRLEMNDLVHWLPPVIAISGAELVEMLGPGVSRSWRRIWVKGCKSARPLRLREIVAATVQEQLARRAWTDAAFQLALAQTGLHLAAPWQA